MPPPIDTGAARVSVQAPAASEIAGGLGCQPPGSLGAEVTALKKHSHPVRKWSHIMGMDDKIKNAADEAVGRVKEGVGAATDNRDLENEGKVDRAKADLHQAGEKVKDTVRDATN